MADHIAVPSVGGAGIRRADPAWAPLGEPLFRSLWIAAVISYTGTWMQNVGAGWLMTQLTTSPLMVSLVQAAAAVPVFLVVLPAGALADMVDRRRLLLFTQGWMVVASAALGVLTLLHAVDPWVLLIFTFLLGLGAVMNDPAWQAITPDVVSPARHASAVALNSAGFNVARAVGPALGGLVVAAAGSGWSFLLNAASFFGVIYFLCKWKQVAHEPLPRQSVRDAIAEGFRYVRGAPAGSLGADSHRGIQRWCHFPSSAAAGDLPAPRRTGIWLPADLFWAGRARWGGPVAAVTSAVLRRRPGGRCNPRLCGHDLYGRTEPYL